MSLYKDAEPISESDFHEIFDELIGEGHLLIPGKAAQRRLLFCDQGREKHICMNTFFNLNDWAPQTKAIPSDDGKLRSWLQDDGFVDYVRVRFQGLVLEFEGERTYYKAA
ncbi:MAG: hypothetical protein OXB84_01995, partial [Halobacteriovoraceae bacterium]|nr:hypothetical protein [Halobacteriovoraceae bacterium]